MGAGVIGLTTAREAARRGMAVAVVDPEPGRGASWAAAGMLAPVSEVHHGEEPLLALALESARRWPAFAAELAAEVGRPIGYRTEGTLVVAADDGDRAWVEELYEFQRGLGLGVQWLAGRRARELEPDLAPGVARRHLGARRPSGATTACSWERCSTRPSTAGVDFHRARVRGVDCSAGRVTGVRLEDGTALEADAVVVAAGCWSGRLEGFPPGAAPAVRPVKGQILRLRPRLHAPVMTRTVRAVVHGSSVYAVPRLDGTVVLGATVEERGFDASVTAGAVYELLRDAHRVMPGLAELELGETTAGLRPGSPDNAPMVGRPSVPGADGLVLATGHYRQGILLAPHDRHGRGVHPVRRRAARRVGALRAGPIRPRPGARRYMTGVPCWTRG